MNFGHPLSIVTLLTVAAWLLATPACQARRQGQTGPATTKTARPGQHRPAGPAPPAQPTSTTAATQPTPAPARPAMRRVHVLVSGKVQRVGFRLFTLRRAVRLKLTGWVKNLRDGRVEVLVEGPAEKVEELLAAIRQGPPQARVDELKVAEEPFRGEFTTFEVRF